MVTLTPANSQQTFQLAGDSGAFRHPRARVDGVSPLTTLASDVDWSQVHAVRLLGVAGGALILLWAIRAMFGRKR
jgi:hypothetical protein